MLTNWAAFRKLTILFSLFTASGDRCIGLSVVDYLIYKLNSFITKTGKHEKLTDLFLSFGHFGLS